MSSIDLWKAYSLAIVYLIIAIFWDHSWIQPFKLIVVFFHETSHALGALLTNGSVESIQVFWDESGYTITRGGSFLAIASAGYIGCITLGSLMLYFSLKGKCHSYCSVLLGFVTAYFVLNYSQGIDNKIYFLLLGWAMILIIAGILFPRLSKYLLYYMGGVTSLYSLFDLSDFFRGEIIHTDAGKLASHYAAGPLQEKIMAYAIAIFMTILSLWISYRDRMDGYK